MLSVLGLVASCIILFNFEGDDEEIGEIDYRRLHEYKLGQAVMLLVLMAVYAMCLAPLRFYRLNDVIPDPWLNSFWANASGHIMLIVAAIATFAVWYLVSQVLGIYMRPTARIYRRLIC